MNYNRNQRFKMICAAADKIVEETGVSPSEVSGYAVSMAAFGRKPNGDFYILFGEWLKQRRAIPGSPPVDMPAEAAAALEEWVDHFKAQIMQRVTSIVREVAAAFEQTTGLRVVALERLCADQVRRYQEVLGTLVDTEAELEAARMQIAALANDLQAERDKVQRLFGRLEERGALAQVQTAGTTGEHEVSADHLNEGDPDRLTLAQTLATRLPEEADTADDGAELDPLKTAGTDDAVGLNDKPSATAAPPFSGGQAEVPPVNDAIADRADGGDGDRG